MNKLKNVGYQIYKHGTNFIGKHGKTLDTSKFLESGVLTPDEFILSGEHLCHKCNTWKWGDTQKDKVDKRLNDECQYLVTKGIPCEKRVKELQKLHEEQDLERDAEDGWVETLNPEPKDKKTQQVVDIDDQDDGKPMQIISSSKEQPAAQDEVFDIDDSDDDDDNPLAKPAQKQEEAKGAGGENAKVDIIPQVIKVRKYDLSITYDFYTQTPRLWLTGYTEDGQPLTQEQIFEDIAADYAKKTVTMETHPHTGLKQASIHPCNHAKVMKTLNDTVIANGGQPSVDQCMFVFLKFINSVIPTIQYDFTVDLELE